MLSSSVSLLVVSFFADCVFFVENFWNAEIFRKHFLPGAGAVSKSIQVYIYKQTCVASSHKNALLLNAWRRVLDAPP